MNHEMIMMMGLGWTMLLVCEGRWGRLHTVYCSDTAWYGCLAKGSVVLGTFDAQCGLCAAQHICCAWSEVDI